MGSTRNEKEVYIENGEDISTHNISIKSEKDKGDIAAIVAEQEIEEVLSKILNSIDLQSKDNENTKKSFKENIEEEIIAEINSLSEEHNLVEAIKSKPIKLGLFSVRVINAIANSFMGVPAAAIIIAADQILTGHMLVAMSTPDKIFIIILALAILITYLVLAYKTEAKASNHGEISESINCLFQLSTILQLDENSIYVKRLKNEAVLEKSIKKLRTTNLDINEYDNLNEFKPNTLCHKLLQNEINFAKSLKDKDRRKGYLELYKCMKKLRENKQSNTIIYHTDPDIYNYLNSYYEIINYISENSNENEWLLLEKKLSLIEEKLVIDHKNKDRFSTLGNIIGMINAAVNGMLACAFGIGGITAFIMIFSPGVAIPLSIVIPVSIVLFVAGTIHSGTITRHFMRNSFENFGSMIDKENSLYPEHSFLDWVKFILKKMYKNRFSLVTSLVTAIAITILSIVSVTMFVAATPIPTSALILITLVVGSLTFLSCNTSFNSVLMAKEKEDKAHQVLINKLLSNEEKYNYDLSQQTKNKHIIIAIGTALTLSLLLVYLLPTSIGLLTPLMIGSVIGFSTYIFLGIYDSEKIINAKNPSELTVSAIVKTRIRLMVAGVFGASFAITAGPAIAKTLFAALVFTSPQFALATSVIFGVLIAAAIYYVMPLIFWDVALKPPHKFMLQEGKLGLINNDSTKSSVGHGKQKDIPHTSETSPLNISNKNT